MNLKVNFIILVVQVVFIEFWYSEIPQSSPGPRSVSLSKSPQPWVTALPVDSNTIPAAPSVALNSLPRKSPPSKVVAVISQFLPPFDKLGDDDGSLERCIRLYGSSGLRVHVYYAGNSVGKKDGEKSFEEYYGHDDNIQIHFIDPPTPPLIFPDVYGTGQMNRSFKIYRTLVADAEKIKFDAFLFDSTNGISTSTIQAKRSDLAFQTTTIVVGVFRDSSRTKKMMSGLISTQNDEVLYALEDYSRNFADLAVYGNNKLRDQLAKFSLYEAVKTDANHVIISNADRDYIDVIMTQAPVADSPPIDCSHVTIGIITFPERFDLASDLLSRLSTGQTCSNFKVLVFVNSNEPSNGKLNVPPNLSVRITGPPNKITADVGSARNAIIHQVDTKYVVLFDDDDIPRDDYIYALLKAAISQDADLVTCHTANVEQRPSVEDISSKKVDFHHLSLAAGNVGPAANFFVHHTGKANVLLKTETAKSLGPCLPELSNGKTPFVDWGMYTNFILNNKIIAVVPEPLYYYVMHSSSSIYYSSSNEDRIFAARKIVNEYCRHYKLDYMGCELLWLSKQISLAK